MSDHDGIREASAAYVLGALDPDERRRFETHLADCAECQRDVAALAPLPGMLARVDGLEAESMPETVADLAVARAGSEWAAMERSRRFWRWSAAVAALLAIAVFVWALLPNAGRDDATAPIAVRSGSVVGEVTMDGRPWGTAVEIEMEGLPHREGYVAWVVDTSGAWQQAAAWGPTPTGVVRVSGASGTPLAEVAYVAITDIEGERLVTATPSG